MGPWFVRDPDRPFRPGCSYETLVRMIDRGQVTKLSIIRGPTTKQFWSVARHVSGVAHLLGYCHNCDAAVDPRDHGCHACGVSFGAFLDRDVLGLPEVRPLPWEADLDEETRRLAAPDRVSGWGRPGEAGGISRFASDDELRETGPGGGAAPGAGAAAGRQSGPSAAVAEAGVDVARAGEPIATPVGQDVFDEYASSAVTRALQRKVASQQRTMRLLAILLVVVAIGSSAVLLAVIFRGSESSTVANPPPSEPTADADAALPAGVSPALVVSPTPRTDPDEPGADAEGAAPSPPAPNADVPALPSDGSRFLTEYARAHERISAAERTQRPMEERIRDYEQALEILRQIDATATSEERPVDLAATIKRVEHELERLRLKEFFG
jgi:hypothetical protein